MGNKATITYYDYDTEQDLFEHEDGELPPLGSHIQIQETDIWYQIIDFSWKTGAGLEVGCRRVACPL